MAETAIALPVMAVKPLRVHEFTDWKLVEDVGRAPDEFQLQLDEFLHEGETYVNGEAMLERAKEKGDLAGQSYGERILRQQEDIPEEWQQFVLIFAGTVWRGPGGGRYVLYLSWDDEQWYSYWDWLEDDFGSHYRLVRLCKS